jgi:hypothetical protein
MVGTRHKIYARGSFIININMSFYLERKPAQITLFLGIPKTKACENILLLFFLFVGGKIQFKNSIQD